MLSYLRVLSIFTSLRVVFLTISSSSDSLNFLMATVKDEIRNILTYFACFLVFSFVNDSIGAFPHYSLNFIFIHFL